MSLPPFSGDDATCPKCGNRGASTRYQPYRHPSTCPDEHDVSGEHLDRECSRCDYGWAEAIVNAKPPDRVSVTSDDLAQALIGLGYLHPDLDIHIRNAIETARANLRAALRGSTREAE